MTAAPHPPLSIVIPSARRADLLTVCLISVLKHAPAGSEIVVIDDGSPGGAVSRAAAAFPGVRAWRHSRSRGFCTAANAGIRLAAAPVVELLNDDTTVTAGWAKAALARFNDPAVVAVAPLVLRGRPGDDPVIDSTGDEYDLGGFARPRCRGQRLKADHLEPAQVSGASGCAGFYRRNAVLAAGGFPDSFVAYFEDVDLSCRLRAAGGTIVFEPHSRVWHQGSASYGRSRGRLLERQSCNEERLFWRNTTGRPRELLRHAAVLAGKALRRLDEGRLTPWLCGRLRAWALQLSRRDVHRWTS